MSELALSLEQELLSARDIATLLKITPRAVRLRVANVPPLQRDGIQAWPLDLLPVDYQMQLKSAKKRAGVWTFADMVRVATPRWQPDFKFATLPAFSQLKAHKVRSVMLAYFEQLENGAKEHQANCAARTKWLEEFAEACSEKTIRRWAQKIEDRGNIEWAPLEAYADRKSCPHINARLESRQQKRVPGELIRAIKALSVLPDMNFAAAYRALELDWQVGREVPGIGKMTEPRQKFPFTVAQLRKFAPSMGARKLGNRGNAEARRDALPHMTRTYADLRPCEMYAPDDTRINVTTMNDLNGDPAEMKTYICMEVASRKIVGYVMREGSMRATDVDALMARVMRNCGIAAPNAGYRTIWLMERGSVACTPQKKVLIESMFPGQVEIRQTSMDGGQNFAGDYVQSASGHWMGKGVIESFMRTLGYITRHIAGQRGSTRHTIPRMVGYPNGPHAGSQVKECWDLINAARSAAYQRSNGADVAPHAKEATDALGLELPLLYTSEFRQAFALAIMAYNEETDHRREGFRQVSEEKPEGGLRHRNESSNERWAWLNWRAEQVGKAPQRIAPADAVLLLHKAQSVTVRKNGVYITVDGKDHRYWHPNSLACAEVDQNSTLSKEFMAVRDPDDLSEIYILRNPVGSWKEGDVAQFLECLPLYDKAGATDGPALGRAAEDLRQVHNRKARELAAVSEPFLQKRSADRANNVSRMDGVVTTTNGECRVTADMSQIGKSMRLGKAHAKPAPTNGRDHPVTPDNVAALSALLNSTTEAP